MGKNSLGSQYFSLMRYLNRKFGNNLNIYCMYKQYRDIYHSRRRKKK